MDEKTVTRWAKDYDFCQSENCTTPDDRHKAKGLCRRCYQLFKRARQRAAAAAVPEPIQRPIVTQLLPLRSVARPERDADKAGRILSRPLDVVGRQ